ncbi:hypothetical protein GCM10010400_18950 [Streptomyces aculeolatus]|uniref:hypothetical protein n=1 Tax=Streptomyces aculeolatus TaxID=270689 RepID=UPI001CEC549F|nr:hypothetical protein [Streptomyces aculeolatus]
MKADDFDAFFAARKAALPSGISTEMGKVIVDDEAEGQVEVSLDALDDTDDL